MNVSDKILVMYEGEIVGEFDPKEISVRELGLYMSGAKRQSDKAVETAETTGAAETAEKTETTEKAENCVKTENSEKEENSNENK